MLPSNELKLKSIKARRGSRPSSRGISPWKPLFESEMVARKERLPIWEEKRPLRWRSLRFNPTTR